MRRRRDRPRLIGEIVFRHPARCEAASPEFITRLAMVRSPGVNPVKKHGPWAVAGLKVATPSGDPVLGN